MYTHSPAETAGEERHASPAVSLCLLARNEQWFWTLPIKLRVRSLAWSGKIKSEMPIYRCFSIKILQKHNTDLATPIRMLWSNEEMSNFRQYTWHFDQFQIVRVQTIEDNDKWTRGAMKEDLGIRVVQGSQYNSTDITVRVTQYTVQTSQSDLQGERREWHEKTSKYACEQREPSLPLSPSPPPSPPHWTTRWNSSKNS